MPDDQPEYIASMWVQRHVVDMATKSYDFMIYDSDRLTDTIRLHDGDKMLVEVRDDKVHFLLDHKRIG